MEKVYEPKKFEEEVYGRWVKSGSFAAARDKNKKPFTIVMPPPNITGKLHIGHAFDDTLQDILIRYKRMKGFSALYLPGTDHASIATEVKIIERLKTQGLTKEGLGREEFLRRAREWKEEFGGAIIGQLKTLGLSCDYGRLAFTLDEKCTKAVKRFFIDLYNAGLIYRGERIINWCPDCKTALSDAEVEYEEKEGRLWHIKYPVKEGGFITVATTRPETMLGDTAVCVNPNDKRYKNLIGKSVVLPFVGREIKIIADAYVDMKFGTGAVKITPAHDPNDFEIGKRHNLEIIRIMNDDGSINENGAEFCGLGRYAARKKIIAALSDAGLLVKEEKHTHNRGTCYRCRADVEPLVSRQWFVKTAALAAPAIKAVKTGEIKFVPKRFEKIYFNWLNNIKDWCVSRQLWWGHRIPAFYCGKCGETVAAESAPGVCPKCGGRKFSQDEDVLDTWFSSGLWPFSTLGWPDKSADFDYFYPTDVLVTGYEIIFFWVARMVMSALYETGKPPFNTVFVHGMVRDALGRKMSKSLGNGVDPIEMISKYGGDSLRFSLIHGVGGGMDIKFSEEKIEGARNFINKLWNAGRYVLSALGDDFAGGAVKTHSAADKWILHKYNETVRTVTKFLEKYDTGAAASALYEFTWSDFCDWYIELSKPVLNGSDGALKSAAQDTLYRVLSGILKLLHPFIPFVTEEIYGNLPGAEGLLITAEFPEYDVKLRSPSSARQISEITETVKALRALRTENGTPPAKRLDVYAETPLKGKRLALFKLFIEKLGNCNLTLGECPDKNSPLAVTAAGKFTVTLSGLADSEKEKARLTREIERIENELTRSAQLLSNEGFTAKAPKTLIDKEKEKVARNGETLEILKTKLKGIR